MKVTKYLCDRCRRPIAEDEVCEIRDYQHIEIIHPELFDIQLCPECEEKVFQAMKEEIFKEKKQDAPAKAPAVGETQGVSYKE